MALQFEIELPELAYETMISCCVRENDFIPIVAVIKTEYTLNPLPVFVKIVKNIAEIFGIFQLKK